jgi:TRAP-type C4-dicarboxylate transport system permease small subunit
VAVASVVLIAMTVYTLVEIILRTVFGTASNVLVELVG